MAREIWLKAKVFSLVLENDGMRPLATCGHHNTGSRLVWARPCMISELPGLECWARGIINSSNTALVELDNGYAPLGKADGPTLVEFGMQVRELRNDMSRDEPIVFLPERKHAEKMCLLHRKFCGLPFDLAEILSQNRLKPEYLDIRQLGHIATVVEMLTRERLCMEIQLPEELIRQLR